MKLSIVATLYQSAAYIAEFHRRASDEARQLVGGDFEIVLVNDGSPDHSLDLAVALTETDDHVVVVDLSRNFGHHKAMMTGLAHARGERIFLIDVDLEEEPEYLSVFANHMQSEPCDVVFGVQAERKGGWLERWSGKWFYILFRAATGMALPANAVTARLMTRRYVDALLRHEEREVFINGLWYITGFTQIPKAIKKHNTSTTTYSLQKKFSLFVNSITSFSNAPLVGIFYTGLSISLLAIIYTIYLIFRWLFFARPLIGWTSVMSSIWLIGGLIISFIGVVGIYLSKIFSETKQRPYTIVRQVYARQKK
ncbi:glycosyltransferase family 2 protein [Dyella flagellata]|uniref:Glycosyltransferases n=1 Tax=Dyella flagellata TaxID=1867833 RepID=A0ABQ5XBT8_9GAMM|nr:glycosyltransferase family 2 protein [Dyella flagellata]GLQ88093.1 putative glycosyltransferases [Dyella flagellata]